MGAIGFVFWSVVVLGPALLIVGVVAQFLRRDGLVWLAPAAVVIGFIAGGVVGWMSVPAEWTASLWTTIDAAGDAARYGHPFEHTAQRALMYLFYAALLGEVALGAAALLVIWRLPRSSARTPRMV